MIAQAGGAVLGAGSLAEFNLHTVWVSIPHFFDSRPKPFRRCIGLCCSPTGAPRARWPTGVTVTNIQLPLIWETLQLALAATIFSVLVATVLAFLAAGSTYTPASVRLAIRTLVAFCAHHAGAGVGGDVRDGVRHRRHSSFRRWRCTIGSLTKLFYESIETASNKPVRGLAACGATPLQRMRFGLWPQVKPVFLSYSFMRLEINFRQSTILGLVGAGGIGRN